MSSLLSVQTFLGVDRIPESGKFFVSGIRNPWCGIQNPILSWIPLHGAVSITPHYTSLGLLKFPAIVKLNTCMLFYDYSATMKSFLIYLFH